MAIEPDTKDWTWVLTRPCPECGLDAGAVAGPDVAALARANAAVWLQVVGRPDVRDRPTPEVWSRLEYACHVRDVHRVFGRRLERMLTEDDPLFESWDQDRTAQQERYAEQDPATVGRELAEAAATTADRFDSVTGRQWTRTGRRSDGAAFTVETLGRYYAHDWVHHLHDVGAGRR